MKAVTGRSGVTWVYDETRPLLRCCHDDSCADRDDYAHQGRELLRPDGTVYWEHWHCGSCGRLVGSGWVAPSCCFDSQGNPL